MLKLKKTILLLVSLLALTMTLDVFRGDAQTKKGAGTGQNTSTLQRKNAVAPLPIRPGVDYSKFDHATHSPDCVSCHDQGDKTRRVTEFPYHPACEDCHSLATYTVGTRGAFCLICHKDPKAGEGLFSKDVKPVFPEQKEDQFGTKFPHNVHVGLNAQDFNLGNIRVADIRTDDDLKIQALAKSGGCFECHVKDGKENKEENFSMPGHPECYVCHGVAPKNVAPMMNECSECHKPYLAVRPAVSNIVKAFRHDKDHEKDTRPDAKKGAMLDCKFCHKETANSKRMQDIAPPFLSACTTCHNDGKKATAHALTGQESVNMRPDPVKK